MDFNILCASDLYCLGGRDILPTVKQQIMKHFFVALFGLKVPITTAADDKFWDIFPNFRQK